MFENYQSVLNQIQAFGLQVSHLEIGSARPIRCGVDISVCPVDPAKRRSAGWYHLASYSVDGKPYLVGAYGFWKGASNNKVKVELSEYVPSLTQEQKKAIAKRMREMDKAAKLARREEIEQAAKRAQWIWSKYVKEGYSDYLASKEVQAHGVRFDPKGKGTIAIPLTDSRGKIYGLQLIRSNSEVKGTKKIQKKFEPKGLSVLGHFHLIGHRPNEVVLIAEGYATAATVYEAIGLPIAVAFNANNLKPVAKNLRKAYPDAHIIICADDDYLTQGNPGVTKAEEAANAIGGKMVVPNFKMGDYYDIRDGKKLTDFNDLALHPLGGIHLVRAQIETVLQGISFAAKPTTEGRSPAVGGRGNDYEARSVLELDELAERYIFVEDGTGDTFFDTWGKGFIRRKQLDAQMPSNFKFNDLKMHPVWSSRALKLNQVAFDPTCKDKSIIQNRWTGWPIKNPNLPNAEAKCEKALALLMYLTSKEDPSGELFKWILKWLAYPVQHPGAKMDSCLVFKGAQGTGKGFLFVQILGGLYGEYFAGLTQAALEDKFNSDWSDRKLFVVADEVMASVEKYKYKNYLKTLISEPIIRVNPKNLPAYQERNHFNLVFLSNETVPVILENDDRRHCIVETPEKLPEDYYHALQDEVEAGGIEALYQFMLELDLGDFNPRTKPPMTKSKEELIDLGLDSHERFIKEWLSGETEYPVVPVSQKNLYRAYTRWNNEEGENYRHSAKDLKPVLRRHGVDALIADIYSNYHYESVTKKSQRIYEPNETVYDKLTKKGLPWKYKPENKTLAQWRTDGNLQFESLLDEKN